jgi:outer membrane protein TolC
LVCVVACAPWTEEAAQRVEDAQSAVPDAWQRAPAGSIDAAGLATWWSRFGDAALDQLIGQALDANVDLAAAAARLRSARAALAAARGARLPQLGASGSASRQESIDGPSFETDSYVLGIDAAWEADIFGRLRGDAAAAALDREGRPA